MCEVEAPRRASNRVTIESIQGYLGESNVLLLGVHVPKDTLNLVTYQHPRPLPIAKLGSLRATHRVATVKTTGYNADSLLLRP